jgi:hypothetical protein
MAREVFDTDWIKLELIGDDDTLQPDVFQLVEAAEILIKDIKHFACHLRSGHSFLHTLTACGIGQHTQAVCPNRATGDDYRFVASCRQRRRSARAGLLVVVGRNGRTCVAQYRRLSKCAGSCDHSSPVARFGQTAWGFPASDKQPYQVAAVKGKFLHIRQTWWIPLYCFLDFKHGAIGQPCPIFKQAKVGRKYPACWLQTAYPPTTGRTMSTLSFSFKTVSAYDHEDYIE